MHEILPLPLHVCSIKNVDVQKLFSEGESSDVWETTLNVILDPSALFVCISSSKQILGDLCSDPLHQYFLMRSTGSSTCALVETAEHNATQMTVLVMNGYREMTVRFACFDQRK